MAAPTTLMAWISTVSATAVYTAVSRSPSAPVLTSVKNPPPVPGAVVAAHAQGRLISSVILYSPDLVFLRSATSGRGDRRAHRPCLRRAQFLDQPFLERLGLRPSRRSGRADEPPGLA